MIKRGQVTIFIIVAIVIVASAAAILLLVQTQKPVESPEVKEVGNFVSTCLQQVSEDAIIAVGEQGGYYNLPERTNYFSFFPKPYYIYETENLVPGKQILEKEISEYVGDNIDFCFNDFSDFKLRGVEVKKTNINQVNTRIMGGDSSVGISAKIPITITKGNSTSFVSDFYAITIPIRFDILLKASNEITDSQIKDSRTICLTCVQDIAENYNLRVDIIETDDRNEFVYNLIDEQSNFTGLPYEYSFAARYKFSECVTTEECFNALQ